MSLGDHLRNQLLVHAMPGHEESAQIVKEELETVRQAENLEAREIKDLTSSRKDRLMKALRLLDHLEDQKSKLEAREKFDDTRTFPERLADTFASFGGSWTFIIIFILVIITWICINAFLVLARPFDAYPFILLNLVLSCIAALQAPVILMSQNRQTVRDRLRDEIDFERDRLDLKVDTLAAETVREITLELQDLRAQLDRIESKVERPQAKRAQKRMTRRRR